MTKEELFATAGPTESVSGINYLVIDEPTRIITIPLEESIFGTEYEKDAEEKYFKMPRYVDNNIDISTLNIQVVYQNAVQEIGKSIVQDIKVTAEEITFKWVLPASAVGYKGVINFLVKAVKTDSQGTETIVWSTTVAQGTVLKGLNDGDIVLEPADRDTIAQFMQELENAKNQALQEIQTQGGVSPEEKAQIEQNKNDKLSKLNACTSSVIQNGKPLGGTVVKKDDKITLTTNTTYGRYDVSLTNILDNFNFIVVFWAEKDSIYPFDARVILYCYDEKNNNLGEFTLKNIPRIHVESEGKYVYKYHVSGILKEYPLTKKIDIGFLPYGNSTKISFYTYNVISDLYDLDMYNNFNDFFDEKGYFVDGLYYSTPYSLKSNMSDVSNFSRASQYSSFSEPIGFEKLMLTEKDFVTHAVIIDSINDNKVVVSPAPNTNFGGVGLLTKRFLVSENRRYVLIIKSNHELKEASFINKSGNGYVSFPSNNLMVNDIKYTYYDINTDNVESNISAIYPRSVSQITTINFIALIEIPKDMSSSDLTKYLSYKMSGKTYNIGLSLKELYDLTTTDSAKYTISSIYENDKSFDLSRTKAEFNGNLNSVDLDKKIIDFNIDRGITFGGVSVPIDLSIGKRTSFVLSFEEPLDGDGQIHIGFLNPQGSWGTLLLMSKAVHNGKTYYYTNIINDKDYDVNRIQIYIDNTQKKNFKIQLLMYGRKIDGNVLDYSDIPLIVKYGIENINIYDMLVKNNSGQNSWTNKNVLFIGDSLTAAKKYQVTVKEKLGINIYNHCKGGAGLIQMVDGDKGLGGDYDNETNASGELKPLSVNDVSNKNLIIFYGGYNNRESQDGKVGDLYPEQNTIAGMMQYCINRIYSLLKEANNLTCRILIVTVDCAGNYPWIDADGYTEFPKMSGQNMGTLANIQKDVAESNSLACLDLYHNSGINRNTWDVFGANPNAVVGNYSPYKLNSAGVPESDERIRYVNGQSYYQKRNGQVVLEKYEGTAPYPYNGDQLHKSPEGYKRIGECIVGAITKNYGN